MRQPSRRHHPRGVSLVESLAALVVFSVGILGVLQANVIASGQNAFARRQSAASNIAQDLAETFERLPFTDANLAASTLAVTSADFTDLSKTDGLRWLNAPATGAAPLLGAANVIAAVDGSYEVAWRVADEAGGAVAQAKRIVIMVRYRVPGLPPRQLNFWTVKYNPSTVVGGLGSAEAI